MGDSQRLKSLLLVFNLVFQVERIIRDHLFEFLGRDAMGLEVSLVLLVPVKSDGFRHPSRVYAPYI